MPGIIQRPPFIILSWNNEISSASGERARRLAQAQRSHADIYQLRMKGDARSSPREPIIGLPMKLTQLKSEGNWRRTGSELFRMKTAR
jgi:hypothetical protein